MFPTRRNLDLALDALAAAMPRLMSDILQADRLGHFTSLGDELFDLAHPNDKSHVWSRLEGIQREHGLIPRDEGGVCDDGAPPGPAAE